jgi:hypothetical protein
MLKLGLSLLFSLNAWGSDVFHFPPGDPRSGLLSEERMQAVTNSFIIHSWVRYTPASGPYLNPKFDWSMPYFMAGSQLDNNLFTIHLSGAIARLPGMNELGLAFVLCHELAHYYGGEPKQQKHAEWASLEGQSDYWGAGTCMKEWLTRDSALFSQIELHPIALKLCRDEEVCAQVMSGGEVFFRVSAPWIGGKIPSLDKRDSQMVTQTNQFYPNEQCRLDTIKAAALDKKRPRCWYKD